MVAELLFVLNARIVDGRVLLSSMTNRSTYGQMRSKPANDPVRYASDTNSSGESINQVLASAIEMHVHPVRASVRTQSNSVTSGQRNIFNAIGDLANNIVTCGTTCATGNFLADNADDVVEFSSEVADYAKGIWLGASAGIFASMCSVGKASCDLLNFEWNSPECVAKQRDCIDHVANICGGETGIDSCNAVIQCVVAQVTSRDGLVANHCTKAVLNGANLIYTFMSMDDPTSWISIDSAIQCVDAEAIICAANNHHPAGNTYSHSLPWVAG